MLRTKKNIYCREHVELELERVCLSPNCSDRSLMCRLCQSQKKHRGHRIETISKLREMILGFRQVNFDFTSVEKAAKDSKVKCKHLIEQSRRQLTGYLNEAEKRAEGYFERLEKILASQQSQCQRNRPQPLEIDQEAELQTINAKVSSAANEILLFQASRDHAAIWCTTITNKAKTQLTEVERILRDIGDLCRQQTRNVFQQNNEAIVKSLYDYTKDYWYQKVSVYALAQEYDQHAQTIQQEAMLHNPKAMFLLGRMHDVGQGLAANPQSAKYWLRRAVAKRQPFSFANIFVCADSDKERRQCLRQGAQLKDFRCLAALGEALIKGNYGLDKDVPMGIKHLNESADMGYPQAVFRLGYLAQQLPQQFKQPEHYFRRGVEMGHRQSRKSLADILFAKGIYSQALKYYMLIFVQEEASYDRIYISEKIEKCLRMLGKPVEASTWKQARDGISVCSTSSTNVLRTR